MARSGRLLPVMLAAVLLAVGLPARAEGPARFVGDALFAPEVALAKFLAQRGDSGQVLETLEPAMADASLYAKLPRERAYQAAVLYAAAAESLGEWGAAHRASVLATGCPQAKPADWERRFHTAILAADGSDAYAAFQRLADAEPLQSLSGRQLERFDRLLGMLPDSTQARLALGREMEREKWEPLYVAFDPSRVWLDYALALQEKGDSAAARAAAARITDPLLIVAIQSDKRFDPLVAGTPVLQDAKRAAERYLAWARRYANDNPRMLNGRIAEARALVVLGRSAEALSQLDDADVALGRGPHRTDAFDDLEDEPILGYWRTSVLIAQGRSDEAIGARAASAACHCSGLDAVMLAEALLNADRAEEAQHWLDSLSENGLGLEDRMRLAQARVCVSAAGGRTDATSLAFLADHEAWAPEALVNALICTGDIARAAATVVRQLGDPQTRLDALAGLQTYAAEPGGWKAAAKLRSAWATMAERPEVRAAVLKVGRLGSSDLQRRGPIS